jgi:hypothetical protein
VRRIRAGVDLGSCNVAGTKAMTAFVLGLWMRGDAAQTLVVVYTDPLVGSQCTINQIDPAG